MTGQPRNTIMRMRKLQVALAIVILTAPAVAGASSPKAAYTAALAHERSMRNTDYGLQELRAAIAKYEAVVRRAPASGYSDNALWQASGLALEAYERYRDERDRRTAQRLLETLVRGYPASSLVVNARERLRHLQIVQPRSTPARAAQTNSRATPSAGASIPESAPSRPPSGTGTAARLSPPEATNVAAVNGSPSAPGPASPAAVTAVAPVPSGDVVRVALKPAYVPETPVGSTVVLRDVRRTNLRNGVRIAMHLDAEAAYRLEELANPRRVFFDFPGTQPLAGLVDATLRYANPVVREVRVGARSPNATRVVLDLNQVSNYNVFVLYNPYRVVVDCVKAAAPKPAPSAAKTSASEIAAPPRATASLPATAERGSPPVAPGRAAVPAVPDPLPVKPTSSPDFVPVHRTGNTENATSAGAISSAAADGSTAPGAAPARHEVARIDEPVLPVPRTDRVLDSAPTPPTANASGRFSLARQLGLGISRIVIDPGHGGHDPGAKKGRLTEAELVLDVALRLEKLLLAQPGVEVLMTRRTDVFVPLEERTALANREQADLFLSIHANASRNTNARGVETYFLNFASSPDAQEVAARENASSGRTMRSLPDIVQAIALNNKLDESRDLAAMVQDSMVRKLRGQNKDVRDLGVKRAPFVVLIGATMPSVLAEVAFVTNRTEGQLLATSKYRQRIAEALFDAIGRYQRSLKTIAAARLR